MQQDLGSEKQAMQQSQIDNSILGALKNGSIDEATANAIFQDPRIGDGVKKQVADTIYPSQQRQVENPINFGNERNIESNRATGEYMNVDNSMSQYDPNLSTRDVASSQGYGN
jgi:peptidoglycan hydrolase-like protein with peptidoglycan-binding domain